MIEDVIAQKLNRFNVDKLNILDIGCHDGCARRKLEPLLKISSFWIGFDPCDYGRVPNYNQYFKIAVDNVKIKTQQSFTECLTDSGTNSLLELNFDCLTHNIEEYDKKWYVFPHIEEKLNTSVVTVDSAFNLLKSIDFSGHIHFVKVDVQGKDIAAVKSLETHLNQTYFIQIETVMTHDKNRTLYKGQSIFEEDKIEMEKIGFKILYIEDYSVGRNAPPEADVLFYNTNLISL